MKTKSRNNKPKKTRPRNVWNSVRKLQNYLKKADIEAMVFMDSLQELRDAVMLDVRAEIVRGLCNTVHGDLLNALLEYRKKIENGADSGDIGENAVMIGLLDTLMQKLCVRPFRTSGERFSVRRDAATDYEFEEYPEAIADDKNTKFEVEVLRPGWKIDERIIIKPKVIEISSAEECRFAPAVE
ncbi:MAG: hypothetical protein M0Z71_11935 [Nitrospiraceae bacterium]|nr:hypothetical protein [Nitrospiraceae bacterium]